MTLCVIVHHQNNKHPCTNIHMHTQQISAGFSVWLLPPSLLLLLPIPPFFFFASLAVCLQDASCCHNSTNVIIFTVSSSTTNCTTFVCILGLLMSFPNLLALMMTAVLLFSSVWSGLGLHSAFPNEVLVLVYRGWKEETAMVFFHLLRCSLMWGLNRKERNFCLVWAFFVCEVCFIFVLF
jgi:hypothetical protein